MHQPAPCPPPLLSLSVIHTYRMMALYRALTGDSSGASEALEELRERGDYVPTYLESRINYLSRYLIYDSSMVQYMSVWIDTYTYIRVDGGDQFPPPSSKAACPLPLQVLPRYRMHTSVIW